MQHVYLIPQGAEGEQDGVLIDCVFLAKSVVRTDFIEVADSYRLVAAYCCQNGTSCIHLPCM